MEIKELRAESKKHINKKVTLEGWIRFNRVSKNIGFLEMFDGSTTKGIQVVYKVNNKKIYDVLSAATNYSAISLEGNFIQGKNDFEIEITKILNISPSKEDYNLGKKEHGLEFLREIAQTRTRTKLFQSIFRVRSTAFNSIHNFFSKNGFLNVNTPIFTSNDAEGAGESFFVKTKNDKTFFSNQATLTVSGQLHAEAFAQAFKKVYTFGPTFRAENSNTTKHASEFWMLEPEATFCDYNCMMKIVFDLIQHIIKDVLEKNLEDLEFLQNVNNNDAHIKSLVKLTTSKMKKISYTKAIEILQDAVKNKVKFENSKISFGIDLATEHEKYLSGVYAKGPLFVFDYPAKIKSFYMYKNNDGKTVRGFDMLIPLVGELVGGSQREDNYDKLMKALKEKNIDQETLNWYLEMRKEGYAPSSGFGLGFERLIMFLTGMENIRDVIPFPRTPGKLNF